MHLKGIVYIVVVVVPQFMLNIKFMHLVDLKCYVVWCGSDAVVWFPIKPMFAVHDNIFNWCYYYLFSCTLNL